MNHDRDAPAVIGMLLEEVDTPALLVDLDAFEANLRLMQQATAGLPVQVRPHAKTHKCPTIALAQMAHGAVGVCCQKVSEAEALVAGGVPDVMISNEVVGAAKLARVAALARRTRLSICVDAPEQVEGLTQAMQNAVAADGSGATLDVLVEIDVGAKRCGVPPGEPAVELARRVVAAPHLRFAGLQAYQGLAQHIRHIDDRRAAITTAAQQAADTRDRLQCAGIECPKITGAGTGTFLFEAASAVYGELQPGSYIFMDGDYAANDWRDVSGDDGDVPPLFQHSLFVWTTVMSRMPGVRVIVDAGLKSLSIDSGMPLVVGDDGLVSTGVEYTRISDEHGVIEMRGAADYALGDKLKLIPGHCDPTVNLYDYYVGVRNGRVEAIWPITGRGCVR